MAKKYEGSLNGQGLNIAIITTRWNDFIVDRLLAGAQESLTRHGVTADAIDIAVAPGAYEVPMVARNLSKTGRYHGIVALGCVIRGSTPHFDYVAGEAATGIAKAMADTGIPISFGVLTTDTIEQSIERAGTKAGNKGSEAALAVIEMANLLRAIEEA